MAKITTGTTNGDIKITPNGTGKTVVGTGATDATVQSSGDYNLVLQTGNATTGSITITDGADGNIAITPNGTGAVTTTNLTATGTASVAGAATFNSGNADVDFTVKGDNGNALFVDGGTNDISFYEDTGSTAKFFWDASEERLGIGTTALTGGEAAQIKVIGSGVNRSEYYSPDGYYYGSFGQASDAAPAAWIAIDSSYNQSSAVSAGVFLSPWHADANGTFCGHTIKSLRSGSSLVFSSCTTNSSAGSPAVETESMRIDSSGHVRANTFKNLAGTGAPDFPNGLTLAGNTTGGNITGVTLDDYEEGTWTPVPVPASGSITSYSSSGQYTKIGDTVFGMCKVELTNVGTGSGILRINGLPFNQANLSRPFVSLVREDVYTGYGYLCFGTPNDTYCRISTLTNGGVVYSNGYTYTFSFTYKTS